MSRTILAVAVLLCCLHAKSAGAALIGYDYTAVVTSITGNPSVSVGDTVYGTMRYTNSPSYIDSDRFDPTRGFYGYPAEYLSIYYGPNYAEGRVGRIEILNRDPFELFHVFHDSFYNVSPWIGGGGGIATFDLGGSSDVFTSDALPASLGQFSDWSGGRLTFSFMLPFSLSVQAEITSLSLPEPTTLLLVASGFGVFVRRRFKRSSNRVVSR